MVFRRRSWKFLFAEAGEVDKIESVSVGGTMLLHRVLGELVCIDILNDNAAIWLETPVATASTSASWRCSTQ